MLWNSSPDSAAEPEAPQEEVSDEVFNLQCQVNFLTEQLAERVFAAECEAYPAAIRLLATGKVRVDGRHVTW